MVSTSPAPSAIGSRDMPQIGYEQLVTRARRLVESCVPEGATVAVVSRGDSELLRLAGRTGWHFPRNEQGVYAGHHPAGDFDAIAHLEAARAGGATHLFLPSTALWWLDHYTGFKHHLEARYERVADQPDTGIIFSLAGSLPEAHPDREPASDVHVEQVRAVAKALLPEGTCVLVASSGDDRLLDLGGPIGWHFPQLAGGVHSAVRPPDSSAAVAHVQALRAAGAEYLIFPRDAHWWLEHYAGLREHLRDSYAVVTRQSNVCTIYDLREQLPQGTAAAGRRKRGSTSARRPRTRGDRRTNG